MSKLARLTLLLSATPFVIPWHRVASATPDTAGSPTQAISMQTPVQLDFNNTRPAFRQIIDIAVQQHIPLGIVVGPSLHETLCEAPPIVNMHINSLGDLVKAINSTITGYKASVTDETLNITPATYSEEAKDLLSLNIQNFHAEASTFNIVASDLWMYVRGAVAPNETTFGGGLSSTQAEKITFNAGGTRTVQSLLNGIVRMGSGGVWVLYDNGLKDPVSQKSRPFVVMGYLNQETLIEEKTACVVNPQPVRSPPLKQ